MKQAAAIAPASHMTTDPIQPDLTEQDDAPQAKKPIDQQLDELLLQIEEVEPGTIDPAMLPQSSPPPPEETVETAIPEPAAVENPPEATPQAPPTDATNEQADMLAALNSALQDLSTDPPADEPSEPEQVAASETSVPDSATDVQPAGDDGLSMEDRLQQEIAALMNGQPQADPPADTPPSPATPSTNHKAEDQIAMEIEDLLNTEQPASDTPAETASTAAINELDEMLAQEIDSDDELPGDFQSVEDVTAGLPIEDPATLATDDEHAATARDVAAELDNQPEDLPASPPVAEPTEDPFAVLAQIAETVEKNEVEHQRRVAMQAPDWQHWLDRTQDNLLNLCYWINWPARRFLNNEWRTTLGQISLLVVGTSSLFLIAVLLFG